MNATNVCCPISPGHEYRRAALADFCIHVIFVLSIGFPGKLAMRLNHIVIRIERIAIRKNFCTTFIPIPDFAVITDRKTKVSIKGDGRPVIIGIRVFEKVFANGNRLCGGQIRVVWARFRRTFHGCHNSDTASEKRIGNVVLIRPGACYVLIYTMSRGNKQIWSHQEPRATGGDILLGPIRRHVGILKNHADFANREIWPSLWIINQSPIVFANYAIQRGAKRINVKRTKAIARNLVRIIIFKSVQIKTRGIISLLVIVRIKVFISSFLCVDMVVDHICRLIRRATNGF